MSLIPPTLSYMVALVYFRNDNYLCHTVIFLRALTCTFLDIYNVLDLWTYSTDGGIVIFDAPSIRIIANTIIPL